MKQNVELPTLRSILEPNGSGFCLQITTVSGKSAIDQKGYFPFVLLNESDPFYRIISGKVVTNGGSVVKDVFLLVQHDVYPFPNDPIAPLTNGDIELLWQNTLTGFNNKETEHSGFLFAEQVDGSGSFVPFESLFFCQQKKVFFPPVCPSCGATLSLCRDKEILVGAGLQPYMTSLKRYLFCPSCMALSGSTTFYTYRLDHGDPSHLKDRWAMMQDFGALGPEIKPDHFPCPDCGEHESCYGAKGMVKARMAPVAFYPFFMITVDAKTLQGADFISLISGMPAEEAVQMLERKGKLDRALHLKGFIKNHEGCVPFLFRTDPRFFLEVLYLKLAFLWGFTNKIWPRLGKVDYPDLGVSLESTWVEIEEKEQLLPLLWDFKMASFEVGGNWNTGRSVPHLNLASGFYHLGVTWFQVLVGNGKQDVGNIQDSLIEALENGGPESTVSFREACEKKLESVFSPKNIFWDPDAFERLVVSDAWRAVWYEVLALGWSLVRASLHQDPFTSMHHFRDETMTLQQKVKEALFAQGAISDLPSFKETEQKGPVVSNGAIYALLKEIGGEWRSVGQEGARELDETAIISEGVGAETIQGQSRGGDNLEATVVVSTEMEETAVGSTPVMPQEDDVQETIVLSRDNFSKSPPEPQPLEDGGETVIISQRESESVSPPDDMPETVIVSNVGDQKTAATDDLAETVVLSPRTNTPQEMTGRKKQEHPQDPVESEMDLSETVVLAPGQSSEKKRERQGGVDEKTTVSLPNKKSESSDDEVLEETVMIRMRPPDEKN